MLKKISNGLFILLTFVWILVLFIDYMDKHPMHVQGFVIFKYYNFLLFLQLFGLALFVIVQFINVDRIKRAFYTGGSMLLIIAVLNLSILFSFDNFIGVDTSFRSTVHFLIRYFNFIGILIGLYTSVYVVGNTLLTKVLDKGRSPSLSICVGLMVLISCLFVLGAFGTLTTIPVLVLFLVPLVFGYKKSLEFIKLLLIQPIKKYNKISYWGYLLFYLAIIAIAINFLSILSPYPYGFDARNYYLNVTQLIAENGGLVSGFQPYSWQLLMSVGFIIFDSHEVAILISFSSYILVLIGLNEFARKIINININLRLLIICILTCTPAIYNQLSIDVKIDFALLFFQIVIVHQFFKYVKKEEQPVSLLILLGLLSGFALSIKFTHLYLIATLVIIYWSRKGGIPAMLSAASFSIGIFLISGIDDVGGLRSAHLGVEYQQWIIAFIGLVLLAYILIIDRRLLIKLITFAMIFGVFHLVPIMPWAGKNYLDSKSLSPKTLLLGEAPGFKTSFQKMNKVYKETVK